MEEAASVPRKSSPRALSALIVEHFLNDGMANFLPGVLPVLAVDEHVPMTLIGVLMTALIFGQSFQPLAGWWADRVGGKFFVTGGLFLTTLGAVLMGLFHSILWMVLLLFLIGVGNTLFHPQALTAARRVGARREGLSMSVFLVGGELGRGLGPLAAGLLVATFGMKGLVWLAVPYLITAPWTIPTTPGLEPRHRRMAKIHWKEHMAPTLGLVGFTTLRATATYGIITLAPIAWRARGGSIAASASLVSVMIGIGVIGNLLGGTFSDRWGRRHVLWMTTILSGIFLFGFSFAEGFWQWPLLALLGMALFGSGPVTTLLAQDIFKENPALGSGIAVGFGNGIGALLMTPLIALAGPWGTTHVVWILSALVLLTLPLIVVMHPKPAIAT